MNKKVDLSTLFQNTDWPTYLSQEQRQRLLQEKLERVEVYKKLHAARDKSFRRTPCSEQT